MEMQSLCTHRFVVFDGNGAALVADEIPWWTSIDSYRTIDIDTCLPK